MSSSLEGLLLWNESHGECLVGLKPGLLSTQTQGHPHLLSQGGFEAHLVLPVSWERAESASRPWS